MTAATAEQTTNLYIPPNSFTLEHSKIQQIRLGIQGDGGAGKTWASLTFPNPLVINLDRGLGAHIGRKDVIELPFWDTEWLKKAYPRDPTNIRQAVDDWITSEGRKLKEEQTLVIDGNTGLQRVFHQYEDAHPTVTKQGKYDDRAEWSNKIKYYGRVLENLKTLRCHVVFIAHEQADRNKDGELNGKIKPLLSGQVGDQIKNDFTDWVRALACDKPSDYSKLDAKKLALWGMNNIEEFKAVCETFPRNTIYYWQLESDDICNCKITSLINFPRYIPANYQSFIKYLRK